MFLPAALVFVRLQLATVEPSLVPGVDLVWRAPPGCPDAAAIARMVSSLVRRSSPTVSGAPRVRAIVTRVRGRWELRLDLDARRERRRRVAYADDCQVLARATALLVAIHRDSLAIALGLDAPAPPPSAPPSEVRAPPEPLPLVPALDAAPETSSPPEPSPPAPAIDMAPGTSPLPAPSPATANARTSPASPGGEPPLAHAAPLPDDLAEETVSLAGPAPERSPPRRPALAGHVRFDGGLDYGVLPGLGGHAGLFAGISLPRVRLELGLVGVPRRIAPGAADGADGRFDRLTGALRACPTWHRAALTFALCVGGEAGAIHGIAANGPRPNPQWAAWLGLSLGPTVRWRVAGPLGLFFGVDGVLALTRPRFSVNPEHDPVFRAGRAGVRATLGLDLQFARRNR